jgi:hypothetical protein
MSGAADTQLLTFATGAAYAVTLLALIALAVVSASLVRRHRPEAWVPLFAAAIVDLLGLVLRALLTSLGPAVLGLSGEHTLLLFSVSSLFNTGIQLIFWILMLVGVVRLATPRIHPLPGAVPPV